MANAAPSATIPVYTEVLNIVSNLNTALQGFSCPVGIEFCNPLQSALQWKLHQTFVETYCSPGPVLFLGMNPGPNGMAINGVPFGDPSFVRDWMKIYGFEATQKEDSGSRLYDYAQKMCGTAEQFFQNCFVYNYCPLFFTKDSSNFAPNNFNAEIQNGFRAACDNALLQIINALGVKIVVGVGGYAATAARRVLRKAGLLKVVEKEPGIKVVQALHPSPLAEANEDKWYATFSSQMVAAGVSPYLQLQ